ncbi:MAG: gamma-glutamyl-gamma-aminobutyrate hydrolase family protein [Candidatus Binatia bacterium]
MVKVGLTQRVEVFKDRNEDRDSLDQAWTCLLFDNGYLPISLPNRVEKVDTLISELRLDGIILTGGNDLSHLAGATNTAPERDTFEQKLLVRCAMLDIPVLGVCRGMQMMVAHYGGELVPITKHVATSHGITVRSECAMPLTNRDTVNSFHNFGVHEDSLGPDLQSVAVAPDGSVEAVIHKSLQQWGIMWHPERPPYDVQDVNMFQTLFKRRKK